MKRLIAASLTLAPLVLLSACQTADEAAWTSPTQGRLIARNSCASCHGVGLNDESSNPDAPEFAEIASRGMSEEALATWLADSHNYPADMGFMMEERNAQALAAYITGLRPRD